MVDDDNSRYDEIMRRLAARKDGPAPEQAPPLHELAIMLDALNAWGFLEAVQARRFSQINAFGPGDFRGEGWLGVVIWYKRRGYYHYRQLHLLGIWAIAPQTIIIGEKPLAYNAPVYNPESYHHHIKRRFDLHYDGDASPPPEAGRIYRTDYAPDRRLAIRDGLQATLDQWAQAYS